MQFKPVTTKYIFDSEELVKDFPRHLQIPVMTWTEKVLRDANVWRDASYQAISREFLNSLDLLFREPEAFPREESSFLPFVMRDSERTINIIALCLQNYARPSAAQKMEEILSVGGSAYAVMFNMSDPQEYNIGVADIVERVPEVVKEASQEVLDNNSLIKEAWHSCYSRNPDYAKTVNKCVDALEGLFKKAYFPNDTKPTLGKFVKDFKNDPSKLSFKGDSILNPKNLLTDLAQEFIIIRGHHTSGTGKQPTKEEAVFVLHYSIFVLQIHGK